MLDNFENLKNWMLKNPTATNFLEYLIWVVLIVSLIAFMRRFLRNKFPDSSLRYKSQKGIEIIGYLFIIIITISYFTGSINDFGLAIGLLTAGITITLQELILSIAGSFYIFFVRVYKPGDRIEINGIKGDVIDIDSEYDGNRRMGFK